MQLRRLINLYTVLPFLLLGVCTTVFSEDLPESFDGLTLVQADDLDVVYAKPGLTLTDYTSVMLVEGETRFKKNWQRDYERQHRTHISDSDMARMKSNVTTMVNDVFSDALKEHKTFTLVDTPSSTTLTVRPSIIDLDIAAPDLRSATRSYSLTSKAGAATLYLEGFDSNSGELLFRVIDRQQARDYHNFSLATSVSNSAEARKMFERWADRLHEQLVKGQGVNTKK